MSAVTGASEVALEKVGPGNCAACGIGCVTNPKNAGYRRKTAWLERRFEEGLRFLLFRDRGGRPLGFLEYVPGEHVWRPVDAGGWLFVHCLWVYPRGQKIGGLGGRLIRACIEEARAARAIGVAAIVSDGPWIVAKEIFLKNGFESVGEADRFQLVAHRLGRGPEPRFRDIARRADRYRGLHLLHCAQCPMLPKSVADIEAAAAEHGLALHVTELESAREAQSAPSYYGVFNLVWNGRVLSDHYVSRRRFNSLVRREIRAEALR